MSELCGARGISGEDVRGMLFVHMQWRHSMPEGRVLNGGVRFA